MRLKTQIAYAPFLTAALFACSLAAPAQAQESPPPEEEAEHEEEAEEIIVQGTRTRRRIQDEPIRVEVIVREEIEEKLLMRPGNIAMLVNETPGIRVQVTSPALGAANIRVQGLEGRYTQLLADGLPLYGGQTSSLGLLQIPPTDLGQVEVIKGAASALYGPSALGGVINLVSRRPTDTFEAEALLNATTRDGQDLTAYVSGPLGGGWGASLTGGAHRQGRDDLDGDGWIDIPGYERFTARPRLFWEGASGASLFVTAGALSEERAGGTLPGRATPDGRPFPQLQDTERFDAGLVAELPLEGLGTLGFRASGMTQGHRHVFGDVVEDDRHDTLFAEGSIRGQSGETSWVGGVAFQRDSFRSETFQAFDYSYEVPGLFAQVEHDVLPDLTLAASGRIDFHSEYGTQFSPRVSGLWRPGPWTVRASYGRGFYAPTPFVEEIEDAGLSRLEPLRDLRAETAESASLDIGYARGPIETSLTLFSSIIERATRLVPTAADRVRLVNLAGDTRVQGSELLLRYRRAPFTVTGSYVYMNASEPGEVGSGRRRTPLVPRHTAGLVAVWERHGRGRIGVEAYYTGKQPLEDNPYRTESRPYLHVGILGEIALGRVRLFANAENILGVRQTRYDPLLLPQRLPDGRWTVDVWAPTEGFILNAGVRLRFGGEH
ncbi:MAG: TonB-dependent receptor; Outer membrane receptor for ferrienterochelin and colicins [uncultured Sphingosinicella sp.]|uniref:TonB-dependent receptor Outer membrane receptor for ferrienterochelin and colicins n=1 Tax=uncultured Sphingosinicella sp. TaxID=478748 RepID=A0A6J4TSQ0_9SPHN|nr:TonB-dependent receptor [uncultured Sphingosinicella sp.]CAA9530056.1 MAG: TonB-dependent receptor; Outer membrane receptor for ferrienterochelin and colicins [uncultured Sphingosinicella sp.]